MGCSKLCESVGVEHDCAGVFGMEGEALCRLFVSNVIELPLLFSIAAYDGVWELKVSFNPSDGADPVGLGMYEGP